MRGNRAALGAEPRAPERVMADPRHGVLTAPAVVAK